MALSIELLAINEYLAEMEHLFLGSGLAADAHLACPVRRLAQIDLLRLA